MLRTLSLVLCVVAASQQLDISKFSVPVAVEMGGDAELLCEHDGTEELSIVKWFWSPDGADEPTQIYQRAFGGEKKVIIPRTEPLLNISKWLDISKFSVPVSVEMCGDAELLCEHDGTEELSIVKWFWSPDGADEPTQIYQRAFGGEKKVIIPRTEPLLNISKWLDISKFSVPVSVEMCGDAELLCEHDGTEELSIVKWFWSPDGADEPTQIYQRAFGGEKKVIIPRTEPLLNISKWLDISKFSVPVAVEMGGDAELLCEHDGTEELSIVKWFWSPDGADEPTQIYQRAFGGEKKVIIPRTEPLLNITLIEEDQHNLALWDLQPEHSGTFECQVEVEQGDFQERRNASDLVVYSIGDGPKLSFEGEEEVLVVCEAVGVAPQPDITISYDSTTFNTTVLEGPIDGLYNVSTNATLNRQDIEGVEISCKLSFEGEVITSDVMEVADTYHSAGGAERTAALWAMAALATLLHLQL
ncbi:uncharacterized protein LOC134651439 isoform X2 [Cydia amplana]|uniref:uncharacterized protein LOC134651439 isoform X2 n=1 Tax=Cydia amplana TaxID=1869771 RepID=UPI002FE5496E